MTERTRILNDPKRRQDTTTLVSKAPISRWMSIITEKFDAVVNTFYKYTIG